MALLTKTRSESSLSSWESIFPNPTLGTQQSTVFVKKLLAIAVSNIAYLRTIFPERAFGDKKLDNMNLKVLKEDGRCPGAYQLIQWVKGCFEALDRKYLRAIVLGIYQDPSDCHTAIETYTFRFSYTHNTGVDIYRNDRKIGSSSRGSDDVRNATIKLLRSILVLTQTLDPLPDDVYMAIKLFYLDSVTPAHYNPSGFEASSAGDFCFREEAFLIDAGHVETPFHDIQMRVKALSSNFDDSQIEIADPPAENTYQTAENTYQTAENTYQTAENTGQTAENTYQTAENTYQLAENTGQTAENTGQSAENTGQTAENTGQSAENTYQSAENTGQTAENTGQSAENTGQSAENTYQTAENTYQSAENTGQTAENTYQTADNIDQTAEIAGQTAARIMDTSAPLACPCGIEEETGLILSCVVCGHRQHAVCFGILDTAACIRHVCEKCPDTTDPQLSGMTRVEIKSLCLWRRCLSCCSAMSTITQHTLTRLMQVSPAEAGGLIQRLRAEEFICPVSKCKKPVRFSHTPLLHTTGLVKYFIHASERRALRDITSADPNKLPKRKLCPDNSMERDLSDMKKRKESRCVDPIFTGRI